MPRASYVYDRETGKLIAKAEFYARQPAKRRSHLPTPMIIGDIGEVRSMVDGQTYTSRKHWRDHLKAHGMVELGNDMPSGPDISPGITEADVAEAYQQCEQGAGAKPSEAPPEGWVGNPIDIASDD